MLAEYTPEYVRVRGCHLNAVCQRLFGFKPLKKWPQLSKLFKEVKGGEQTYRTARPKKDLTRPMPKLYQVTWKKFLEEEKIQDPSAVPPNDHFESYFDRLIQRGLSQTTIR